jgi:hypothetical protein
MTLILVHCGGGGTRRCDAHCYNARKADCTCVCGGRNHGQGLHQAVAQTAAHLAEYAEWYGDRAVARFIRQRTFGDPSWAARLDAMAQQERERRSQ